MANMPGQYDEGMLANSVEGSELGLIGGGTAAKQQPALERFANELAKQGELLNVLESRLETVSTRLPQKGEQSEHNERIHISTLIEILRRNNHRIDRLINEIDL